MKKILDNGAVFFTVMLLFLSFVCLGFVLNNESGYAGETIALNTEYSTATDNNMELDKVAQEVTKAEETKVATSSVSNETKKVDNANNNTTKKTTNTKKTTTTAKKTTTNENKQTNTNKTTTTNVSNVKNVPVGTISVSNSDFEKYLVPDDGSYYFLNHSLSGKNDNIGVPFMDFRATLNSRKMIVYSHSSKTRNAPFNYFQKYHNNKSFFQKHKYIIINYQGKTYKYEIFSVYIAVAESEEDEGLEYFHRMSYSDAEWAHTIQEYKNNSEYDTGVSVSGSDKILIIQTCSMDNNYYHKHYRANQLVMGKLVSVS